MKLSFADQLALIYSSAGSLRKTAAAVGMSHQQVSRILHRNLEGGDLSHWQKKPAVINAIAQGFESHRAQVREVSKRHGIPVISDVPIYTARLPMKNQGVLVNGKQVFTGTPEQCIDYVKGRPVVKTYTDKRTGEIKQRVYKIKPGDLGNAERVRLLGDRVGALHTHWIPDRLREAWLKRIQKSQKYYSVSAGSLVNLQVYKKTAAKRIMQYMKRGGIKTEQMIRAEFQLRNLLKDDVQVARLFTPYTPLNPQDQSGLAAYLAVQDLNTKIQDRHSPAVGQPGTALADQYLLQLDTRASTNANSNNAKPGKAPGTAGSRKRGNSRK